MHIEVSDNSVFQINHQQTSGDRKQPRPSPADLSQLQPGLFVMSGSWTARTTTDADQKLAAIGDSEASEVVVDGSQLEAIDSVGVWLLQQQCKKIRTAGRPVRMLNWPVDSQKLLDIVEQQIDIPVTPVPLQSFLEKIGRPTGLRKWRRKNTC